MNPAMAGLGALTKQSGQPTGRSPESMSQTMALAKQMSDMQLADVLAGKSMNIPQYVAMTEAMGRKQLRTAMQGMTAMTSAKQPTEREKLLSEMMPRQAAPSIMNAPPQGAGLDQLPADNMQGLGHADGGIIAFKDRAKVEDPDAYDVDTYQTDQDMGRAMRKRDQGFLGSVGEELGAFGRFIKNPLSSKDPKANYMRELEAQAQRDEESQFRAGTSAPVGGRPNNVPLGISPDMLERVKGQKEQVQEQARVGAPPIKYARTDSLIPALTGVASSVKDAVMATPLGRTAVDKASDISNIADRTALRVRLAEQYGPMALGTASGSNADQAIARQILNRLPNMSMEELTALAEQKGLPASQVAVPSEKLPVAGGNLGQFQAADREALTAPGVAPPNSPAAAPKPDAGPSTGSGPGAGGGGGGTGGGGPSGGGYGVGLPGTALSKFATEQAELLRPKERNKDYYAALEADSANNAKQIESGKSQAQGEFLMNIGAALMSTPNIGIALSKGVQAGLPGLAASRKEINALTKDQRDYKFNIAKAKEARDQGDEMLALNYLKLAEESTYHAGMVGAYMARASADKPWGRTNITAQQGIKDWKDLRPSERQELQQQGITPYNFFEYVNSRGTWVPTVSAPPDKAQVLQLPKL